MDADDSSESARSTLLRLQSQIPSPIIKTQIMAVKSLRLGDIPIASFKIKSYTQQKFSTPSSSPPLSSLVILVYSLHIDLCEVSIPFSADHNNHDDESDIQHSDMALIHSLPTLSPIRCCHFIENSHIFMILLVSDSGKLSVATIQNSIHSTSAPSSSFSSPSFPLPSHSHFLFSPTIEMIKSFNFFISHPNSQSDDKWGAAIRATRWPPSNYDSSLSSLTSLSSSSSSSSSSSLFPFSYRVVITSPASSLIIFTMTFHSPSSIECSLPHHIPMGGNVIDVQFIGEKIVTILALKSKRSQKKHFDVCVIDSLPPNGNNNSHSHQSQFSTTPPPTLNPSIRQLAFPFPPSHFPLEIIPLPPSLTHSSPCYILIVTSLSIVLLECTPSSPFDPNTINIPSHSPSPYSPHISSPLSLSSHSWCDNKLIFVSESGDLYWLSLWFNENSQLSGQNVMKFIHLGKGNPSSSLTFLGIKKNAHSIVDYLLAPGDVCDGLMVRIQWDNENNDNNNNNDNSNNSNEQKSEKEGKKGEIGYHRNNDTREDNPMMVDDQSHERHKNTSSSSSVHLSTFPLPLLSSLSPLHDLTLITSNDPSPFETPFPLLVTASGLSHFGSLRILRNALQCDILTSSEKEFSLMKFLFPINILHHSLLVCSFIHSTRVLFLSSSMEDGSENTKFDTQCSTLSVGVAMNDNDHGVLSMYQVTSYGINVISLGSSPHSIDDDHQMEKNEIPHGDENSNDNESESDSSMGIFLRSSVSQRWRSPNPIDVSDSLGPFVIISTPKSSSLSLVQISSKSNDHVKTLCTIPLHHSVIKIKIFHLTPSSSPSFSSSSISPRNDSNFIVGVSTSDAKITLYRFDSSSLSLLLIYSISMESLSSDVSAPISSSSSSVPPSTSPSCVNSMEMMWKDGFPLIICGRRDGIITYFTLKDGDLSPPPLITKRVGTHPVCLYSHHYNSIIAISNIPLIIFPHHSSPSSLFIRPLHFPSSISPLLSSLCSLSPSFAPNSFFCVSDDRLHLLRLPHSPSPNEMSISTIPLYFTPKKVFYYHPYQLFVVISADHREEKVVNPLLLDNSFGVSSFLHLIDPIEKKEIFRFPSSLSSSSFSLIPTEQFLCFTKMQWGSSPTDSFIIVGTGVNVIGNKGSYSRVLTFQIVREKGNLSSSSPYSYSLSLLCENRLDGPIRSLCLSESHRRCLIAAVGPHLYCLRLQRSSASASSSSLSSSSLSASSPPSSPFKFVAACKLTMRRPILSLSNVGHRIAVAVEREGISLVSLHVKCEYSSNGIKRQVIAESYHFDIQRFDVLPRRCRHALLYESQANITDDNTKLSSSMKKMKSSFSSSSSSSSSASSHSDLSSSPSSFPIELRVVCSDDYGNIFSLRKDAVPQLLLDDIQNDKANISDDAKGKGNDTKDMGVEEKGKTKENILSDSFISEGFTHLGTVPSAIWKGRFHFQTQEQNSQENQNQRGEGSLSLPLSSFVISSLDGGIFSLCELSPSESSLLLPFQSFLSSHPITSPPMGNSHHRLRSHMSPHQNVVDFDLINRFLLLNDENQRKLMGEFSLFKKKKEEDQKMDMEDSTSKRAIQTLYEEKKKDEEENEDIAMGIAIGSPRKMREKKSKKEDEQGNDSDPEKEIEVNTQRMRDMIEEIERRM